MFNLINSILCVMIFKEVSMKVILSSIFNDIKLVAETKEDRAIIAQIRQRNSKHARRLWKGGPKVRTIIMRGSRSSTYIILEPTVFGG